MSDTLAVDRMRDLSGSVGAAGAVPPIRGGKCHLWCLAPGQRIYGRWRALVRRARRLAVGPAAGIRYYPLSRLLEKGRCPGHCPERNERLAESIEYERPDGAHNLSPVPFGAAQTAPKEVYHCSACASQTMLAF